VTDTPEDQNRKAKELREKFAAAMNPETPKGDVISLKEVLLGRILDHQAKAQAFLDQAKKINKHGDLDKDPFAAPMLAKMNDQLAKAAKIKEHVQFIIERELEEAAKNVPTPAQIPTAQVFQLRPGMNWNMGPKPTNLG
jgi:hypothetical protein